MLSHSFRKQRGKDEAREFCIRAGKKQVLRSLRSVRMTIFVERAFDRARDQGFMIIEKLVDI